MKQFNYRQNPDMFWRESEKNELQSLVNTAWNFTSTALWDTSFFSDNEINEAKKLIRFYFLKSKNFKSAYSIFCQRVLLTRQYIKKDPKRFIPLPSIWLHPENEKGFVGTRSWYQNICVVRQSLPNYKIELKALADAVWDISQEPTENNFNYWKNYFIATDAIHFLSLFLNTVANQQFSI